MYGRLFTHRPIALAPGGAETQAPACAVAGRERFPEVWRAVDYLAAHPVLTEMFHLACTAEVSIDALEAYYAGELAIARGRHGAGWARRAEALEVLGAAFVRTARTCARCTGGQVS